MKGVAVRCGPRAEDYRRDESIIAKGRTHPLAPSPNFCQVRELKFFASEIPMSKSRRAFLRSSTAALAAAAFAPELLAQQPTAPPQSATPPPGQPSAFGTAPAVGPEVSAATFAEAEKLVRVQMTEKDRAQAASNWRQ